MRIRLWYIIVLFLVSCISKITPQINSTNMPQASFPPWIEGCDRFRPLFQEELDKYPSLKKVFDLPMIYALVYQESLCQTKDEFREYQIQKGVEDEGWKGGIMQVDGCWRWGAPYNCSTVQQQIMYGMSELNSSYGKIESILIYLDLNDKLDTTQKLSLLFLAYNRGYYVPQDAMVIYKNFTDNKPYIIFVNCTEKDVCMNDYQYIDITQELQNYTSGFDKSLLVACRTNYGYMHNFQGDYCTGPGYGLNYPVWIFDIYHKIMQYREDTAAS